MAVKLIDLLAVEFVIGVELLGTLQSISRFGNTVDEYRWAPVSQAENGFGDGRRVSLDRDRIFMDMTANRSRIRQEYPLEEKFPALAELSSRTIQLTDKPLGNIGAHGYNVEIAYDQSSGRSAFSYIGEKAFAGLPAIDNWNLIGGLAAFRFVDSDGTTRNIHIEPRFRSDTFHRVYLHLNLHFDRHHVPEATEIEAGFILALGDAKKFISGLEGTT